MSLKDLMYPTRNPYLMGKDKPIGRQTEYYAQESIDFIKSLGKYADNHYRIEIQKWGETEKQIVECRIEDSFDEQANLKRGDDWKDILFYEPVENISIGMLAWFENNTWMGFNTRNIASLTSSVTVRRCDNVLNFKDEYNNITPVPFVFDKYTVLNSTTIEKASQPVSLINGYKNAWVQYNDLTATMKTNDRFIINGMAWSVRGIDKVSRQKTDDRDSVSMIAFVLMRTEERDGDDLVKDIADADANKWELTSSLRFIRGNVGDSGKIPITILHNGIVEGSYGVTYLSSDESIISVDENGRYELLAVGDAMITCAFDKNPDVVYRLPVNVLDSTITVYKVSFEPVEAKVPQYEQRIISAYLYINGVKQNTPVTFEYSGVPSAYYAVTEVNSNNMHLWCNAPYNKGKLRITAKAEVNGTEYSEFIELTLVSVF